MFRIICVNCKQHIYNYTGERKGKLKPELAIPVEKHYPKPKSGEYAICPSCGKDIFYNSTNPLKIKQWRQHIKRNT